MGKVDKETAEKDVNTWLDYKQIGDSKRESNVTSVESLVQAVMDGFLVLNTENKSWIQTLKFPLKEELPVEKLEYKPRLKLSEVHTGMQGAKTTDAYALLCAYVSVLTGKPKNIIKALDTEDYGIAQSIATFFL